MNLSPPARRGQSSLAAWVQRGAVVGEQSSRLPDGEGWGGTRPAAPRTRAGKCSSQQGQTPARVAGFLQAFPSRSGMAARQTDGRTDGKPGWPHGGVCRSRAAPAHRPHGHEIRLGGSARAALRGRQDNADFSPKRCRGGAAPSLAGSRPAGPGSTLEEKPPSVLSPPAEAKAPQGIAAALRAVPGPRPAPEGTCRGQTPQLPPPWGARSGPAPGEGAEPGRRRGAAEGRRDVAVCVWQKGWHRGAGSCVLPTPAGSGRRQRWLRGHAEAQRQLCPDFSVLTSLA